jgi:hypothetical protein
MMPGKLVIHVGLPKTATTTLQSDWFPLLEEQAGVRYLGVRQPRTSEQDPVYVECMRAIHEPAALAQARLLLEGVLRESRVVVWSEEMLTAGNAAMSWPTKLERLGALVRGLDYLILCGIRDPVEASFSYFVEKHSKFVDQSMSFEKAAIEDDAMAVYRYGRLLEVLDSVFPAERTFFIGFHDITAGHLERLADKMGVEGGQVPSKLLPNRNAKSRAAGHVMTGRKITFSDLPRAIATRLGLRKLPFWPYLATVMRPMAGRMDRFSVHEDRVKTPTARTVAVLRDFYATDWAEMQNRMRGQA